jgi:arylsulfatase
MGKNILPYKEVTPMDMGYTKKGTAADRMTFKYYPGVETITIKAAPSVSTKHFIITVPATINSKEDQGVLVALGDEMGGYALYVKDNKLTFVYNKYGAYTRVTSDINVPIGKNEFKFDFTRTSMVSGKGNLYINDKLVGSADFSTAINLTLEGF